MGLEGNIYQILDLVLYAYGGDRAFIYELDEELGCTVDLYERCRKGFMPYNDKYKSLDIITINNLMFKVKEYGFYSAVTEEMPESIIRDRMVDGLVVRNMGTQFPLRSGINCFLSIDNPRRFWGKSTFLKYAAFLLANEVHINMFWYNRVKKLEKNHVSREQLEKAQSALKQFRKEAGLRKKQIQNGELSTVQFMNWMIGQEAIIQEICGG